MSKSFRTIAIVIGSLIVLSNTVKAQTSPKPTFIAWDGCIASGYVGHGAYFNFIGPAVKMSAKPYTLILGMLPSLRIKNDKQPAGAKTNSTITPSLGIGLTGVYKHFLVQLPLYYDAKTSTANGKWNLGVGIGYKF